MDGLCHGQEDGAKPAYLSEPIDERVLFADELILNRVHFKGDRGLDVVCVGQLSNFLVVRVENGLDYSMSDDESDVVLGVVDVLNLDTFGVVRAIVF